MTSKTIYRNNKKAIGVPKTSKEKFDKMKIKNPLIEKLKDVFNLDIDL